jgi:uncharacterized GH25 family protein
MTRLFLAASAAAVIGFGHYTWIAPVAKLETGKPSEIRIGHGHKFPESEEAINARQIDMFAVTPSGARVKLTPAPAANAVTASFTPPEAGAYRIAFVQDRGVSSRTPRGVKPGGRDQNPDATTASRTLRTAVAYAATAGVAVSSAKPLGLEIELSGTFHSGAWQLQLMKQGKPLADTPVEVFLAGAPKAVEAGKTGPDGKLRYQPPAGAKGPAVFIAEKKEPAPSGAKYDAVNYETSLYVSW